MFLSFCVLDDFFSFSKRSGFWVFLVHRTVVLQLSHGAALGGGGGFTNRNNCSQQLDKKSNEYVNQFNCSYKNE